MTCIVGVIDDAGSVHMGGDSAGLSGWHLTVRADRKVFAAHGFLYGFAGSFRLGQILQYQFVPPPLPDNCDLMRYMVADFIPALRTVVGREISSKAPADSPGDFLVAVRGRLFEVCADFQVGESLHGFASVGCGREPALGALHALSRLGVTRDQGAVRMGLEAAEALSGGVRGPFTVLSLGGQG